MVQSQPWRGSRRLEHVFSRSPLGEGFVRFVEWHYAEYRKLGEQSRVLPGAMDVDLTCLPQMATLRKQHRKSAENRPDEDWLFASGALGDAFFQKDSSFGGVHPVRR